MYDRDLAGDRETGSIERWIKHKYTEDERTQKELPTAAEKQRERNIDTEADQ